MVFCGGTKIRKKAQENWVAREGDPVGKTEGQSQKIITPSTSVVFQAILKKGGGKGECEKTRGKET